MPGLAQVIPVSDDILKRLLDMGAIGIVVLVVLVGAVLLLTITRRERAGDRETNQNTSALITVVSDLSRAINSLKDARDLDTATHDRLAGSLDGVSKALSDQQKVSADYQKLVDDSLALMRESVEGLNRDANNRINLIHGDVQRILTFIDGQPGQHEEIKTALTEILTAIEKDRTPCP